MKNRQVRFRFLLWFVLVKTKFIIKKVIGQWIQHVYMIDYIGSKK